MQTAPPLRSPPPLPAASLQSLRGEIQRIEGGFGNPAQRRHVATGVAVLDAHLPGGGVAAGAVHELVGAAADSAECGGPGTLAAWLAGRAAAEGRCVVWFDLQHDLYPPAVLAFGVPAGRFVLVRPANRREAYWGLDQALRCRGVAAAVGEVGRLGLSEARRLQLAAESGGGIGLLLGAEGDAAGGVASRWRVRPVPSATEARRLRVEVAHCRGGRVPPAVVLEWARGADSLTVSGALADRPCAARLAGAPAA